MNYQWFGTTGMIVVADQIQLQLQYGVCNRYVGMQYILYM